MQSEVADSLQRFPIVIRTRRAPVRPDQEQPDESAALKLLPPPLQPQKMSPAPQPFFGDPLLEQVSQTGQVPSQSLTDFEDFDVPQDANTAAAASGSGSDYSTQQFDLYAAGDTIATQTAAAVDDLLSTDILSLTVQGRVIPCIPCESVSPSSAQSGN